MFLSTAHRSESWRKAYDTRRLQPPHVPDRGAEDAVNETIWLTQKGMALMFGVTVPTVKEHLTNIFKDKELEENSTVRKFRIVQKEGNRQVERA